MVDVRYDLAFKLYPYEKVAATAPVRHPVVSVGGRASWYGRRT